MARKCDAFDDMILRLWLLFFNNSGNREEEVNTKDYGHLFWIRGLQVLD